RDSIRDNLLPGVSVIEHQGQH
ncbi:MAG: hypothetical protein RL748_4596, partial [Pseudomonadota bacterium]